MSEPAERRAVADCYRVLHVDEFVQTRAFTKPSKLRLVLVKMKPTRSTPVADVGGAVT